MAHAQLSAGQDCESAARDRPDLSRLSSDSGSQKLQRFGENRGFSHLCRGSTIEVQTKNSTDLEPVPGTELKSVEFFVCTSTCQQLSPLLSAKRLKRLMHPLVWDPESYTLGSLLIELLTSKKYERPASPQMVPLGSPDAQGQA